MQRMSVRFRSVTLSAVVLTAPLSASAGLLDQLSALRSGSTSTTTTPTTSTSGTSSQTVTYTPSNWSQALKGDLYLPSGGTQSRPVVLLLHGGAWQRGDKSSMSGAGQTLAGRGYAAFSINYRFAPGSTYPAQLQDMQQAVRWLQAHASEYKLDMNRLAVWGYSAGGHLAALLAVQPPSDLPPVRAAIAGAAPSNLSAPEARDASSVRIFMGGSYAQIPALYDQASPMAHVNAMTPPFYLYHGTIDTVVPPVQSENFAKALTAAGVPVQLVWLQGKDHSTASGATSLYRPGALAFLDRYVGSATGTVPAPQPTDPVVTPAPTAPAPTAPAPATSTSDSFADRLRSFLSR